MAITTTATTIQSIFLLPPALAGAAAGWLVGAAGAAAGSAGAGAAAGGVCVSVGGVCVGGVCVVGSINFLFYTSILPFNHIRGKSISVNIAGYALINYFRSEISHLSCSSAVDNGLAASQPAP
jgi:hypothetical protein